MKRDQRGIVALATAQLALCLGLLSIFVAGETVTVFSTEKQERLAVQRGESLSGLVDRWAQDDTVASPELVRLLALLRGVDHRIRAGEYILRGKISAAALVDELVSGRPQMYRLTVPEGFSLRDIASRLQWQQNGDAATFMALTHDPEFIATLKLPFDLVPPTLEGLVFPDTYYFATGTSEATLLREMVRHFVERVAPELAEHRGNLDPYQVVTLASIIEKETGAAFERELISGVFHNRLKLQMRLASDPTVIYGVDEFDGNLTRQHLDTPTPYNTYQMVGLPPTPIANPGLQSIRAAMTPAETRYLYFVSKGDGTHYFSESIEAHNQAVWRYQISRSRRRSSS